MFRNSWLQKPPNGVRLNPSSPLAYGLRAAWLFNEGGGAPLEVLGGSRAVLSGSSWRPGRILHDAITDKTTLTADSTSLLKTGQGFTYVIGHRKRDSTNRDAAAIGLDRGTGNFPARCSTHLPYVDGIIYWDYGGVTEGATRLTVSASGLPLQTDSVWVLTTGSRGMQIWRNGRRLASNAANPTRSADSSPLALGRFDGAGSSSSDLVEYIFLYIYHCQLGEAEIAQISQRPYSLWATPMIDLGSAGIQFPTDMIAASDSAAVVASEGTPTLSIIEAISALDSIPLVLSDTAALTQEINKPNVADSLGLSITEVMSLLDAFVISVADPIPLRLIEELPDQWFTVNPALLTMTWQEFVKSAGGAADSLIIMWDEQRDSADTLTFQWVEIRDEIDKLTLLWRELAPVYTLHTASSFSIPSHRLQVT